MPCYLQEHQHELTKFLCILTAIDDMYDTYGSLDQVELFTDAVKRCSN